MKYMKHPDLEAVIEAPDAGVPIYRQSGWELLSEQEVEAHVASMQPPSAAPSEPPTSPSLSKASGSKPEPAPRKSGSKKEMS